MNDESTPKGAHESATTAPSVTDGSLRHADPDTDVHLENTMNAPYRSQLSRIETILDRIVGSLAPWAGAR
jgi:hypothetical protein